MPLSSLVLIPGILGETDDSALDLPRRETNLFERIIRNPLPPGSTPRERECAEMLCAVLQNAAGIRSGLLAWMGSLTGYAGIPVDELEFEIETEGSVEGKRDDLRITGQEPESEDDAVTLLWTVEIKVGAPFHYGTGISDDTDDEEDESYVNQITNYDRWLSRQDAHHKAGFVLAKRDRTGSLPHNLANTWQCITWPQLAAQLRIILDGDDELGEIDRFLGRHLLGFIHHHFGEEGRNMDDHLDFDDIAFLRALAHVGYRTENRVQNLVETMRPVLERVDLGVGTIKAQKDFFRRHHRYILIQSITDSIDWKSPILAVGIQIGPTPKFTLWIEMSPKYAYRHLIHDVTSRHIENISTPESSWKLTPWDTYSWHLLVNEVPLERLLNVDDQLGWLTEYTQKSLTALKESGLIDDIRRVVQQEGGAADTTYEADDAIG